MNDTDLNRIIDFHAHAFPDGLADRAIAHLEKEGTAKAFLDGRVSSLLASMDSTGIGRAVVCSIATKPDQFAPILNWSRQIASARIVPLPSVHPRGPDPVGKARLVAQAGLPGIKLHPYYQDFELDDPALFHFFRVLEQMGLLVVCHTGFDFAFPRDRKADPVRIVRLLDKFPNLRFVATHIGAWEDWDEVERHLLGTARPYAGAGTSHRPPGRPYPLWQRFALDQPVRDAAPGPGIESRSGARAPAARGKRARAACV
jgi:predicted TIM-barrel fold metal-dependent hydrolase